MPDDQTINLLRNGLGREVGTVFTVAGGQVKPALAKRIGYVIYPPQTDDILVSFNTPIVDAAALRIKVGGQPVVLGISDFGPLVSGPLFGRTTGAGPQTIGIVEVGNQY